MKTPFFLLLLLYASMGSAQNLRCDSTFMRGDTLICFERNSISKRLSKYTYSLRGQELFAQVIRRKKDGALHIRTTRRAKAFSDNHGPAWIYYPSGKLKIFWNYVDDEVSGRVLSFYEDGKPKCQCEYLEGKRHGEQWQYYANGQLHMRAHARRGQVMDVYEYYDENGRALEVGTLKNGTGTLYIYDATGRRTKEITFVDGKRKGSKRVNENKF